MFCNSNFTAIAQTTISDGNTETTEIVQQNDESVAKEKKKKKDKSKDEAKDSVQINEAFFISFAINLATILIIIMLIYYPNYKKQEMFFTYFLFNIAIFLLTFLLNKIKISMGAAFGLFAVFSMLRYRTEGISMKDMTYLFIVIAVGLMSAVQLDYIDLGIINATIIIATFVFDGNILIKREYSKLIQYENIEMVKEENHPKLIEDLKERTGLNIHRISIVKIDFLRDMTVMDVYYYKTKTKQSRKNEVLVDFDEKPVI
ncbi:MAG: DUF4956 domain-containing protein [Bacteroidetes bacterium]|nr:DUF4956 domain-containing protein [Bacteroidota bacterium]